MALTLITDDQFLRAPTTPGPAGSSTGVGNGWVDEAGNLYSIPSLGKLVGASNSLQYYQSYLSRPVSENASNASIEITTSPIENTGGGWGAVLRWDRANPPGNAYYVTVGQSGDINISYTGAGGGSATVATAGLPASGALVVGQSYIITFNVNSTDTLHTDISATIVNSATPAVTVNSCAITGYMNGPQSSNASAGGFCVTYRQKMPGGITRVRTFSGTPTPGLYAGQVKVTATTSTSISLTTTGASAGTPPYTYQWYRSTTPTFVAGSGNIIAGATTASYTDTGLTPGTAYYYQLIATDSATPTAAKSNSLEIAGTTKNPAIAIPATGTTKILFIGDSITNLARNGKAPPDQCVLTLSANARLGNVVAVNQGTIASTSGSWQPGGTDFTNALAAGTSCQYAHVMLGTNDTKQGQEVSVATYYQNMLNIVNALVSNGKNVFVSAPPYLNATFAWRSVGQILLKQYQIACHELDNGSTIRFCDGGSFDFFQNNLSELTQEHDNTTNTDYFIHPTAAGIIDLGNLWATGILYALGLNAGLVTGGGVRSTNWNGGF